MNIPLKPTTLALTLGLALAGAAIAQTAPTAAQQQELDAARASLDQAAKRYAELSRKYGGSDAPIRIEQRVLRKPVIGVLLAPDDASGVRIAGVTPDSAAAAGCKPVCAICRCSRGNSASVAAPGKTIPPPLIAPSRQTAIPNATVRLPRTPNQYAPRTCNG